MLSHPLLNALFNEEASNPSKQLSQVRELLRRSKRRNPSILLLLPPADLLNSAIEIQCLFHDYYLLSHVVDAEELPDKEVLDTLNGSQWQIQLSESHVTPGRGFAPQSSCAVRIRKSFIWSPGIDALPHDVAYFVAELDSLMLTNDVTKKFTWFSSNRSTPQAPGSPGDDSNKVAAESNDTDSSDAATRHKRERLRNPASDLGRTKSQREQNMAKVDYCLACLQQDVVSSSELAERFHRAVTAVRSTLIEAGGLYVESGGMETAGEDSAGQGYAYSADSLSLPPGAFTLSQIYDYAERRIGKYLLKQLEILLAIERKDQPSFPLLHKELKFLDLTQVDIPEQSSVKSGTFEVAIGDAALILDRLGNARTSHEMCNIFLSALKRLANPALGTVSADTLLGLFMLTVLRVSTDTAEKLELYLCFVTQFSFHASDTVALRASAGRVSYTLMVVESVLLQLRMERDRLSRLASYNEKLWAAVRGDDRDSIRDVAEHSPSSLKSRRAGKSALGMVIEDENISLFMHLLENYGQIYTKEFVFHDTDMARKTLLMAAASNDAILRMLLNYLSDRNLDSQSLSTLKDDDELIQYYNFQDNFGRSAAFYLHPSDVTSALAPQLCWDVKDKNGYTAILYHSMKDAESMRFFIKFCDNFYEHIDSEGVSLLHLAAIHDSPEAAESLFGRLPCDVDWVSKDGRTPLMIASSQKMVRLLLSNGADPWLGRLNSRGNPHLRAVRARGEVPYVARLDHTAMQLFYPANAENGPVRTVEDFVALSSTLKSLSPDSWLPPLYYSYPERFKGTSFATRFLYELTEVQMQRQSFWLRHLKKHATFKGLAPLNEFFLEDSTSSSPTAAPDATKEESNTDGAEQLQRIDADKSSLFGHEQVGSIVAFMELGRQHLKDVQIGLMDVIKKLCRVQSLQSEDELLSAKFSASLHVLAERLHTRYETFGSSVTPKLSICNSVVVCMLDELVSYAQDLFDKLGGPIRSARELAAVQFQVDDNRERLRLLAEGKLKVSWIGNVEEKRIAEIQSLETAISQGRKSIDGLNSEIRTSHYFLANELSSFHEAQEAEILQQLECYSARQLEKSRTALKRLEFGCST